MQRLLTKKLLDVERAALAPDRTQGDQATPGMTQHQLLEWYFDYMTSE